MSNLLKKNKKGVFEFSVDVVFFFIILGLIITFFIISNLPHQVRDEIIEGIELSDDRVVLFNLLRYEINNEKVSTKIVNGEDINDVMLSNLQYINSFTKEFDYYIGIAQSGEEEFIGKYFGLTDRYSKGIVANVKLPNEIVINLYKTGEKIKYD